MYKKYSKDHLCLNGVEWEGKQRKFFFKGIHKLLLIKAQKQKNTDFALRQNISTTKRTSRNALMAYNKIQCKATLKSGEKYRNASLYLKAALITDVDYSKMGWILMRKK